jgi:hypothetical protein
MVVARAETIPDVEGSLEPVEVPDTSPEQDERVDLGWARGTEVLGGPKNTWAAPEHLFEIHVVRLDNATGGAFADYLVHPIYLGIDDGVEAESLSQDTEVLSVHGLVDRTEGTVGMARWIASGDGAVLQVSLDL